MTEIDACIAIVLAHAIKKKQQKKIVKRLWMKEQFKTRQEFTHENLLDELKLSSPSDFRNFLRMDEDIYGELLSLVGPNIKKQNTIMRDAISPNQRLSLTLRFLATGASFADLKTASSISERSIGLIVMETCAEINKALKDYIKIPSTEDDWKRNATQFHHRWTFPNCLGVINGKHIGIKKPLSSSSFYYNYKKFFSIVLMAIVDANYEFVLVDVDGALSHARIGKLFSEDTLNLPKLCSLPTTDKKMPFVFVGDDNFQLTENLMKPYSQTELTEKQRVFNYRLNRVQQVAENAFGILFSRFRVLQGTIALSSEKVQTAILTCCYLHNFLNRKKPNEYISVGSVDNENLLDGKITEGVWRKDYNPIPLEITQCPDSTRDVKLIREQFCDYFNNEGYGHGNKSVWHEPSLFLNK